MPHSGFPTMNPGAKTVWGKLLEREETRTTWARKSSFACAGKVIPEGSACGPSREFNFSLMSRTVNWAPRNSSVLDCCSPKAAEHTLKRCRTGWRPQGPGTLVTRHLEAEAVSLASARTGRVNTGRFWKAATLTTIPPTLGRFLERVAGIKGRARLHCLLESQSARPHGASQAAPPPRALLRAHAPALLAPPETPSPAQGPRGPGRRGLGGCGAREAGQVTRALLRVSSHSILEQVHRCQREPLRVCKHHLLLGALGFRRSCQTGA